MFYIQNQTKYLTSEVLMYNKNWFNNEIPTYPEEDSELAPTPLHEYVVDILIMKVNIYYSSVRIYFKRNEYQRDFKIENLGFSLTTSTMYSELTLSFIFEVKSSLSRVWKNNQG